MVGPAVIREPMSTTFVPPGRTAVVGPHGVDRRAWELCLLAEVRGALRAGELTVVGQQRDARRH